jgi:hypothetical protein
VIWSDWIDDCMVAGVQYRLAATFHVCGVYRAASRHVIRILATSDTVQLIAKPTVLETQK